MEYDLRSGKSVNLPYFNTGTVATQLIPRPDRLLAGIQMPSTPRAMGVEVLGIMGPGNPAAKFLLFPGDWLVMPQPGYVYRLPKSQVQADEQDELAPVQRIREARADEAFRPTVEAIRTLWVRSGGRAEAAQVFGLRRVAPLYVYGQMAPTCIPGTMHVDAGQYEVGANVWVEPSPLLMCEDGLRKTSPRVAPLILLGREFARWTRQDGEVIHDFGELPD